MADLLALRWNDQKGKLNLFWIRNRRQSHWLNYLTCYWEADSSVSLWFDWRCSMADMETLPCPNCGNWQSESSFDGETRCFYCGEILPKQEA